MGRIDPFQPMAEHEAGSSSAPGRGSPLWVVAIGIVLTVAAAGGLLYHEHQQRVVAFRADAAATFTSVERIVERALERTGNLSTLLRTGAEINTADPPSTRKPTTASSVEFLAWMEPVPGSDDLRVTPLLSASGRGVIARQVLDRDAGDHDEPQWRALEAALANDELTGTDGVVLFQVDGRPAPGFIVFSPVKRNGASVGVVATALRLDRLAESARGNRDVRLHIFDEGDTDERLLLYGPGSGPTVAERTDPQSLEAHVHARRDFDIAGRTWTMYATPGQTSLWPVAPALALLLAGLGLSGVTGVLSRRQQRHRLALERQLTSSETHLGALQRDYAATRETLEREAVARTAAEQYAGLLENSIPDLALRLSPDGTILSASPAAESLLGYSGEVMIGRSLDAFVVSRDRGRAADTHTAPGVRYTLRDAGGGIRQLEGARLPLPPGMSNGEEELLILSPATPARGVPDGEPTLPFREAFDNAAVGMALFHPDTGHCLYVNQALCDCLGYANDELLQLTYHDLTHPADQQATREQLNEMHSAARDTFQLEKRYLHKNGHVVWVLVSGSLVRDRDGHVICVASQIRDITEQKDTERALEEINRRHDLILNAAAEAIFGVDTSGRVSFANHAACHLLSREPATLEGQSLYQLLHGVERASPEEWPVQRCMIESRVKHEEGAVFRRSDGTPFPADYTAAPIVDNERVTGAVVVLADASERQEGEARFRSAFEDVAVGMALIGMNGEFLRANAALCSLVGYDHQALLELRSTELLHPEDREANYRVNRLILEGHHPTGPLEQRLCHRDGGIVWALTSTSVVRDPGGEPRYLLKQTQDITPRKVAESALRTSETRFRGVFDQAAVGMALLSGTNGTVQRINLALRRLLDCDPDDLADKAFTDLVHAEDQVSLESALRDGVPPDGHYLYLRLTGCRVSSARVTLHIAPLGEAGDAEILHLVQLQVPVNQAA